jgi:hypothetical protein
MYSFYEHLINSTEYNSNVINGTQIIKDKDKLFLPMPRKHIVGAGVWLFLNITSELDSDRWLNSHPGRFITGERILNTH